MLRYFGKVSPFPKRLQLLGILLIGLSIAYLAIWYSSASTEREFDYLRGGFSVETPVNWRVTYIERSNSFAINRRFSPWSDARILIYPDMPAPDPLSVVQHMERHMEVVRGRFNMESLTFIQEPTIIYNQKYEMASAVFLVPLEPMPKDSAQGQIDIQETEGFQTLELRAMRCPGISIIVYIYKGKNERFNVQAEAIADSIELNCSTIP